MTTTYEDAVDAIFSLINETWETQVKPLLGYDAEIRWPLVQYDNSPDIGRHWARVTQQNVDEAQTSLRSTINGIQRTRYTSKGFVIIQLFASKLTHKENQLRNMSKILRNMFRGNLVDEKVWFRNAKITEIAPEETWFRSNVSTEYEFDEIK